MTWWIVVIGLVICMLFPWYLYHCSYWSYKGKYDAINNILKDGGEVNGKKGK